MSKKNYSPLRQWHHADKRRKKTAEQFHLASICPRSMDKRGDRQCPLETQEGWGVGGE